MLSKALTDVLRIYGKDHADILATAYEAAILGYSHGRLDRMPDRATRDSFVNAMLAEAYKNGFKADRLAGAALSAVSMRQ